MTAVPLREIPEATREGWKRRGPFASLFEEHYARPKGIQFDPSASYSMMNVDVTYREPLRKVYDAYMESNVTKRVSVPMLNGTDKQGRSSTVHLTDYMANFWIGVGNRYFTPQQEAENGYAWMRDAAARQRRWPTEAVRIRDALQKIFVDFHRETKKPLPSTKDETSQYVVHAVEVSDEWLPFVEFATDTLVGLKVSTYSAHTVAKMRDAIRWFQEKKPQELRNLFGWPLGDTYESNFPFVSNFMTDSGLVSCGNIRIPAGKATVLRESERAFESDDPMGNSSAQIELVAKYEDVEYLSDDTDDGKEIYPFVSVAFDIEVVSKYKTVEEERAAAPTLRRRKARALVAAARNEDSAPAKAPAEKSRWVRKDIASRAQEQNEKRRRVAILLKRFVERAEEAGIDVKATEGQAYLDALELAERVVLEDNAARGETREKAVAGEKERLVEVYTPYAQTVLEPWFAANPEYERTQAEVRAVEMEIAGLRAMRGEGHHDQQAATRVRLEGAERRLVAAKNAAARPEREIKRARLWATAFHVSGVDMDPPAMQDDPDDDVETKEQKKQARERRARERRAAHDANPDRRTTRDDELTSRHVRRIVTDVMQGDPLEVAVAEMAEEQALTVVDGAPTSPFPRPGNPRDVVTIIGVKFSVYGQPERTRRAMLVYGDCDDLPTVDDLFCFETEEDLLIAFRDLQEVTQCDFVKTWNGLGFDRRYLILRAEQLGIADVANVFGRVRGQRVRVHEKNFKSGAKGTLTYFIGEPTGMVHLDGFLRARDLYSLRHMRSFGLSAVGRAVLQEVKEDMPPEQMKRHMKTPRLLHKFARYCGKDVDLTDDIMAKCGMEMDTIAEARLTNVSAMNIVTGGQGVKCQSVIIRFSRKRKFRRLFDFYKPPEFTPEQERERKRNKLYRGAIVVKPVRGLHKFVVFTLDFSSLYPSVMHFFNICYCTLVKAGMEDELRQLGYILNQVVITKAEDAKDGVAEVAHFVAQFGKRGFRGIMPEIEVELKAVRKAVRKLQAEAEARGDVMEAIRLDAVQNNIKKIMNSLYGFAGAEVGKQFRKEVAASITAGGRAFLEFTIKFVLALDGRLRIVYGDTDSVMVVIMGCTDVAEGFRVGNAVQKKLNAEFKDPVAFIEREMGIKVDVTAEERANVDSMAGVELEKVTRPGGFLLRCPKKYVMHCWTSEKAFLAGKPWQELIRGSESFRRETPEFTRTLVAYAEKHLLTDKDGAVAYIRAYLDDIIYGRVPIDEYVMTGGYNRKLEEYAGDLPAHAVVVRKQRERKDGQATLGDRIPFVITVGRDIRKKKDGKKIAECAEDPQYVAKHNIPVDIEYYVDRAISALTDYISAVFFPDIEEKEDREAAVRELLLGKQGISHVSRMPHESMEIVRALTLVDAATGEAVPSLPAGEFSMKRDRERDLIQALEWTGLTEDFADVALPAWREHQRNLRAEKEREEDAKRARIAAWKDNKRKREADPAWLAKDAARRAERQAAHKQEMEERQAQIRANDKRTAEERAADEAWKAACPPKPSGKPLKPGKKFKPLKTTKGQTSLAAFMKKKDDE